MSEKEVTAVNEGKEKALKLAVAEIEKKFGKGSIMRLDDANAKITVARIREAGVFINNAIINNGTIAIRAMVSLFGKFIYNLSYKIIFV